jgi:hypothetical protein
MEVEMEFKIAATFFTIALLSADAVQAQITERVEIAPTVAGPITDQEVFDGFPDFIDPDLPPFVGLTTGLAETRAVYEFHLSKIPNGKVSRAVLRLIPSGTAKPPGSFMIPVEVRSYSANGALSLADFHRGAFVTVFDARPARANAPIFVDVTRIVRNAVVKQKQYLGFVLRTNVPSQIAFGPLPDRPPWILFVDVE